MSDEVLNPYAPPADVSPDDESPRGLWTVAGESLLVRDGARLPPVSLEGEGNDLTPTAREFVSSATGYGILVGLLPLIAAGLWIGYMELAGLPYGFLTGFVIAMVGNRLVGRFQGAVASARIQGFCSIESLRRRARRARWRGRIIWTGFGLVIVTLATVGVTVPLAMLGERGDFSSLAAGLNWILPVSGLGLGLALSAGLWQVLDKGLHSGTVFEGWLEIRGVPRASLATLSLRLDQVTPEMRSRRVCTLFQYRLPLAVLAGRCRNPRVLLILAIMKAKRSPRLEQLRYHWSEGLELAPEAADPDLRRRWQSIAADPAFDGWVECGAGRVDFPAGALRSELLIVSSPDRCHFGVLEVTRVSTGGFFEEEFELAFRTWTGGRCVITATQQSIGPLPASIDFQRADEPAKRLFRRHLARMEGHAAEPVASHQELSARLTAEAEEGHRLHRAAGIQTDFEERLLPEMPA